MVFQNKRKYVYSLPYLWCSTKFNGSMDGLLLRGFTACRKTESRKESEIRWPTVEEMKASSALLERNRVYGSLLKGVFAVSDGGRMRCADYTDTNLHNAYFEGYTQNMEVTNLFVGNFFGEIVHAAIIILVVGMIQNSLACPDCMIQNSLMRSHHQVLPCSVIVPL